MGTFKTGRKASEIVRQIVKGRYPDQLITQDPHRGGEDFWTVTTSGGQVLVSTWAADMWREGYGA